MNPPRVATFLTPFVPAFPMGRDAGFLCFPPLISSKKNKEYQYP